MIKFMKSLWADRRGNTIVIAGAAMPLVVGAAGLATDTIQWTVWKRELQRAADSAAFAGVYARAQESNVDAAVTADLANNNQTGITILTGYPQIQYPTSAAWNDGVQVTLAVQKRLGFSSLFMDPPTITATATAALVDDGQSCLRALRRSGGPGIIMSGSSTANLGCNAMSNSNFNPSVSTSGNSYNFIAPVVSGAGNLPPAITGVTTLRPHRMPLSDPFDGKYSTTPTSNCNKQINGNATTFSPGCYKDFKFTGNKTYTLQDGTYFLDSTSFEVAGGTTVTGDNVTIILTGTSPGTIKLNGTATVDLTAPTSGDYAKMLFIQSGAAELGNDNTINGNNGSKFDGAIYFPRGNVTFTGSSTAATQCAMVVGYTVTFSGNTGLQNSTTGCQANMTVPDQVIRLVG